MILFCGIGYNNTNFYNGDASSQWQLYNIGEILLLAYCAATAGLLAYINFEKMWV